MFTGPNPIHPDHLTGAERLDEVARLLALGLIRLRSRQSSGVSADRGESWLDCPGHRSGHATPNSRRVIA